MAKAHVKNYRRLFKKVLDTAPSGFYDECTLPSYAHKNRLISWLFWKRVHTALTIAGDIRNKRVLDVGCGGGVTFNYLNERNCSITGCEDQFQQLAIDMSDELNIKAEVYREIFEIKDRTFDVIFALDMLEHVENLDLFIDKFMELSHEGTKFIISGPTENVLYKMGRVLIGYAEQGRFHERTIYDIERRFRERHLINLKIRSLFFPVSLFRISAWKKPT